METQLIHELVEGSKLSSTPLNAKSFRNSDLAKVLSPFFQTQKDGRELRNDPNFDSLGSETKKAIPKTLASSDRRQVLETNAHKQRNDPNNDSRNDPNFDSLDSETKNAIDTILTHPDRRHASVKSAWKDRKTNGIHGMKPENLKIMGPTFRKEEKAIATRTANKSAFDEARVACKYTGTGQNRQEALTFLEGSSTLLYPIIRPDPSLPSNPSEYKANGYNRSGKGDADMLRDVAMYFHWSQAGPERLQRTPLGEKGKKCIVPSEELTPHTIDNVPLLHIRRQKRSGYVYVCVYFFRGGEFFFYHWKEFYPMVSGAIYYVYLFGPTNERFHQFKQNKNCKWCNWSWM